MMSLKLKPLQGTHRIKKELEYEQFNYWEKKYRGASFTLKSFTKTNSAFVKIVLGIKTAHSSNSFLVKNVTI